MARTTSDTKTDDTAEGPELVTVTGPHPVTGETISEQVPLDAALALEAQKTGWKRDHVAEIAALKTKVAVLEAQIAEHEAADKAAKADTAKPGRKPADNAQEG